MAEVQDPGPCRWRQRQLGGEHYGGLDIAAYGPQISPISGPEGEEERSWQLTMLTRPLDGQMAQDYNKDSQMLYMFFTFFFYFLCILL